MLSQDPAEQAGIDRDIAMMNDTIDSVVKNVRKDLDDGVAEDVAWMTATEKFLHGCRGNPLLMASYTGGMIIRLAKETR